MDSTYIPPRLKSRDKEIKWERLIAKSAIMGTVVQTASLIFLAFTISESRVNNQTLTDALEESRKQNETSSKTLSEYRDSNKLLDKSLASSNVPFLTLKITDIKQEIYPIKNPRGNFTLHFVKIFFTITNSGKSFANNVEGSWDINDNNRREYNIGETTETYIGDFGPFDANLMPINTVVCMLPAQEQNGTMSFLDSSDSTIYRALLKNEANCVGIYTYTDMFNNKYQTLQRIKYFNKAFPLVDTELSGHFIDLQK